MFQIDQTNIMQGSFAFLRISSLFSTLPIFSEKFVPVQVRILASLSLTFALIGLISNYWPVPATATNIEYAYIIVREILIGVSLGFIARLIFDAITMSAAIVGYQMGFGTANLIMPGSGEQSNAFTMLHRMIALMIFTSSIFTTFS